MEGALVVESEVGGTDMLPCGLHGLQETIAWLCEAGAANVQGHWAPFLRSTLLKWLFSDNT